MLFVSLFAAFVPARIVGEMTSIGTLFAFILVCIGVIVLRKAQPDLPRAFKTPWVPLVPILGVLTCLFMMVFLPADTWIRLIVWMLVGFDIFTDSQEGVVLWHILIEGVIALMALAGVFYLLMGTFKLRHQLEVEINNFSVFKKEAEAWRADSRKFVDGLAQAIDLQE